MGYKLFFVESICNDPTIIESNIRQVKINSPDYQGMDKEAAVEDFLQRIEHYHEQYQTLDEVEEDGLSFMKIFNTGTDGKIILCVVSIELIASDRSIRRKGFSTQAWRSHTIAHSLLPHEHTYHAENHLSDPSKSAHSKYNCQYHISDLCLLSMGRAKTIFQGVLEAIPRFPYVVGSMRTSWVNSSTINKYLI